MLGSWGRMAWKSTLGVLGSWAMALKANILKASMPYTRVCGHCSSGLQSITLKLYISALGTNKTVPSRGLEQEQGLPSTLSQHPSVVLGAGLYSVLLTSWIMGTQPPLQLSFPHCIAPVPLQERQAHTQQSGTLL